MGSRPQVPFGSSTPQNILCMAIEGYVLRGRSKISRRVANNTYAILDSQNHICRIKYHSTYVLSVDYDGVVTLDSGGWQTVTTAARMHWFIPGDWWLFCDKGVWYIRNGENLYPFFDRMQLECGGKVRNPHRRMEVPSVQMSQITLNGMTAAIRREVASIASEMY